MTATPEQVKRLCAASGADEIAALSALERRNGDLLEALLELERQGSAGPQPEVDFIPPGPRAAQVPPPPFPSPMREGAVRAAGGGPKRISPRRAWPQPCGIWPAERRELSGDPPPGQAGDLHAPADPSAAPGLLFLDHGARTGPGAGAGLPLSLRRAGSGPGDHGSGYGPALLQGGSRAGQDPCALQGRGRGRRR